MNLVDLIPKTKHLFLTFAECFDELMSQLKIMPFCVNSRPFKLCVPKQ